MTETNYRPAERRPGAGPPAPRWQEDGLSISFRSCQLTGLSVLKQALQQATSNGGGSGSAVSPIDVGHLDLGENELTSLTELQPFQRLLSLDVSHNNVETLTQQLPDSLLHLNASYNRLESADGIGELPRLIELNLSYNLLTSCQPLESLLHVQVILLGGNRISSLVGLEPLARLELLDLRFNYIEKHAELRLLAINAALRTLTLQGNPVAKHPNYRASVMSTLPALLMLDGQKMPRSSAQRQAGLNSLPATAASSTAFSGGTATSATRPSTGKPVRTHTRYASGDGRASAATPALTLLPASAPQATPAHGSLGGAATVRKASAPTVASTLAMSRPTAGMALPTATTSGEKPGFLKRGSGIGGKGGGGAAGGKAPPFARAPSFAKSGGGGERMSTTTDARGLVRSMSAEALRPGMQKQGSSSSSMALMALDRDTIPSHLTHHLSPPLQRSNSSRSAAGAATERAPASSVSAERGLMELAFEIGCGINVQRKVFVPAESPVSLLESLLKMQPE